MAIEYFPGDVTALARDPLFDHMAQRFDIDPAGLASTEQHFDPTGWLAEHGWTVITEQAQVAARRYGRRLDANAASPLHDSVMLTATLATS